MAGWSAPCPICPNHRSLPLCAVILLVTIFGPILKIVADVVRYAGSGVYRERLHAGLIAKVNDLDPAGKSVLLVPEW